MEEGQLIKPEEGQIVEALDQEEWYIQLVEHCRAQLVETFVAAQQTLIEGYHELGTMILKERKNFERFDFYGHQIIEKVAKDIGKGRTTVYDAVRVAKKFPTMDEINRLPDGKALTWRKLVRQYLPDKNTLPESTEIVMAQPEEHEHRWKIIKVCEICGEEETLTPKELTKLTEPEITMKVGSLYGVTEEHIQYIADYYKVPVAFVRSQYDDLVNYCESKGKSYRNYFATLRSFVKRDMVRIKEKQHFKNHGKAGIDARHVK